MTKTALTMLSVVTCALFSATVTRAATCTADPTDCHPYVATLQQFGNTTVATGSGEFDLAGLTLRPDQPGESTPALGGVFPGSAALNLSTGLTTEYGVFGQISGPTNFGPGTANGVPNGGFAFARSVSGFLVAKNVLSGGPQLLLVPVGYTSGTLLAPSQSIFTAAGDPNFPYTNGPPATFANIGITPGLYEWTWGPAPDQSFTLDAIAPPTVPLPATLPLFATGLGALGLLEPAGGLLGDRNVECGAGCGERAADRQRFFVLTRGCQVLGAKRSYFARSEPFL